MSLSLNTRRNRLHVPLSLDLLSAINLITRRKEKRAMFFSELQPTSAHRAIPLSRQSEDSVGRPRNPRRFFHGLP